MSALGQKQTCAAHKPMSALPLKADMTATNTSGLSVAAAHEWERLPNFVTRGGWAPRITFLFYRG